MKSNFLIGNWMKLSHQINLIDLLNSGRIKVIVVITHHLNINQHIQLLITAMTHTSTVNKIWGVITFFMYVSLPVIVSFFSLSPSSRSVAESDHKDNCFGCQTKTDAWCLIEFTNSLSWAIHFVHCVFFLFGGTNQNERQKSIRVIVIIAVLKFNEKWRHNMAIYYSMSWFTQMRKRIIFQEKVKIWSLMVCLRSLWYTQITQSFRATSADVCNLDRFNTTGLGKCLMSHWSELYNSKPLCVFFSSDGLFSRIKSDTWITDHTLCKLLSRWFDLCHFRNSFFLCPWLPDL